MCSRQCQFPAYESLKSRIRPENCRYLRVRSNQGAVVAWGETLTRAATALLGCVSKRGAKVSGAAAASFLQVFTIEDAKLRAVRDVAEAGSPHDQTWQHSLPHFVLFSGCCIEPGQHTSATARGVFSLLCSQEHSATEARAMRVQGRSSNMSKQRMRS